MKLRIRLFGFCAAIALGGQAFGEAVSPLGDALEGCTPGAKYADCADDLQNLVHAKTTPLSAAGQSGLIVKLPMPFDHATIRKDAAGRISAIALTMNLAEGKGRQLLVKWLGQHTSSAPTSRASSDGNASICGASGWGIAWSGKSGPEVQLQLDDASALNGQAPTSLAEADAVVTPKGNGRVDLCFIMPGKAGATPTFAAEVMKQFIETIPGLGTDTEPDAKAPEQQSAEMQDGIRLYKAGKYAAAAESLMNVKRGSVGIPELHYWLALSYDKLGAKYRARFFSAINSSIRGNYAPAYLYLADHAWNDGKRDTAIFYYKGYLEQHGDEPAGVARAKDRSSSK